MKDKIEIQLSKTKIICLLIISILFLVIGVLLILNPENFLSPSFKNEVTIRVAGIVLVSLLGIVLLMLTKKLFSNKMGLVIDEKGITDNASSNNIGLIDWQDISNVKTIQIASTQLILIETDKPGKYIKRAKNRFSKRAMKSNFKIYGSPIFISSSSLKIKFKELESLIKNEFKKRNE